MQHLSSCLKPAAGIIKCCLPHKQGDEKTMQQTEDEKVTNVLPCASQSGAFSHPLSGSPSIILQQKVAPISAACEVCTACFVNARQGLPRLEALAFFLYQRTEPTTAYAILQPGRFKTSSCIMVATENLTCEVRRGKGMFDNL